MRPRYYSDFWTAWATRLICLSEDWHNRDESVPARKVHPLEGMPMNDWLRLEEWERSQVVYEYGGSCPSIRFVSTEEKQRRAVIVDLTQCADE